MELLNRRVNKVKITEEASHESSGDFGLHYGCIRWLGLHYRLALESKRKSRINSALSSVLDAC
jgi:hypothetical protein